MSETKQNLEQKKNNKYLLEKQLETLKLFFERKLLTKEQYEFEVETLTTKIKIENAQLYNMYALIGQIVYVAV